METTFIFGINLLVVINIASANINNIASANHPYLQSRTELRRARLTTSG